MGPSRISFLFFNLSFIKESSFIYGVSKKIKLFAQERKIEKEKIEEISVNIFCYVAISVIQYAH